jgi:hypothetical protein
MKEESSFIGIDDHKGYSVFCSTRKERFWKGDAPRGL